MKKRSLRTRLIITVMCVIVAALAIVTFLSVLFIRNNEHRKSDQLLLLLCETGERNLDYYFVSVQKSVSKVASFVEADLDGLDDGKLRDHVRRVEEYFDTMASKTNGVLTYYYRIDPEVSADVKGFWYTDLRGDGFVEHEVTDISLYDTSDTTRLVWFTVLKHTGGAIWLPPYITDNLNVRVISYNIPIYWRGVFVGVIGIEIDYTTMAEQVDSIRLYSNGYSYLSDAEGNLFYHPKIDVSKLTPETMPETPDGVVSDSTFIRYRFNGVDKVAAWLPLSNGMRLNVAVPVSETEGDWLKLVWNILIVAVEVLIASGLFLWFYTRRITRPLEQLAKAAEQVDKVNYNLDLCYDKDDEVGRLTKVFIRMSSHMKDHISDLNRQVFVDPLTHVKNKGAFSGAIGDIQNDIDNDRNKTRFAIVMFDCDDLKRINDQYGHEKGDEYLKVASTVLLRVFRNSPVFRIGGDEFCVILQNEDYQNRDALIKQFRKAKADISTSTENRWEQVHLSMGMAVFDPDKDRTVNNVVRRADAMMYEDKRIRKSSR